MYVPTLALASVAALRKELFPADGFPTQPITNECDTKLIIFNIYFTRDFK